MEKPDHSWFQVDYQARRTEILHRLGAQQAMLNYALLLAGATGGLLGAAISAGSGSLSEWVWPVLLTVGGVMGVLVLYYVRHDLLIAYNAQYIEEVIRRQDPTLPRGALTWEKELMKHRSAVASEDPIEWWMHKALAFARFAPILVFSVAIFGAGIWALAIQQLSDLVFWSTLAIEAVYLATLAIVVWAILADYKENEKLGHLSKWEQEDPPSPPT